LHKMGVRCMLLEAVAKPKPLGVGINLQPNAVRELYELGIGPERLDAIGVQGKEWALVGVNGNDGYSEPRGADRNGRLFRAARLARGLPMAAVRSSSRATADAASRNDDRASRS